MIDYGDVLSRIEKALGRRYAEAPSILNVPGKSLACKVDQDHYLGLRPGFINVAAKWAGMLPETAEEALVKTGVLLTDRERKPYSGKIRVLEEGGGGILAIHADFIQASFIDKALALYGGQTAPPPISPLRIHVSERDALNVFFDGKTPLQGLAFGAD